MTTDLTARTIHLLQTYCGSEIQIRLNSLFENTPALYAPPSIPVLERVWFAAIKLAMQGEKQLMLAEKLYITNTRDLLVCAEFANSVSAHEQWFTLTVGVGRV